MTATLQPFRDTMHADSQIKGLHQNDVDPRFFEVNASAVNSFGSLLLEIALLKANAV